MPYIPNPEPQRLSDRPFKGASLSISWWPGHRAKYSDAGRLGEAGTAMVALTRQRMRRTTQDQCPCTGRGCGGFGFG